VSGHLVILSAPSGGGKTTIARRLERTRGDVGFSVSATTRPPRENERDGVDYYFFTRDEFRRRRDAGEFLEWAEYAGHLYGTLRAEINRYLAQDRHVLLDIEVQGAAQVRRARPEALAIFVVPPSAAALLERLTGRQTEASGEVVRRVAQADRELEAAGEYDVVVVNDELDRAVRAVSRVIDGAQGVALTPTEAAPIVAAIRHGLRTWLDQHEQDRQQQREDTE
jgi:guanylate kinase